MITQLSNPPRALQIFLKHDFEQEHDSSIFKQIYQSSCTLLLIKSEPNERAIRSL